MQIQKLLKPTSDICSIQKMYFSEVQNAYLDYDTKQYTFGPGGVLDTFSYFNGVSVDKWLKYTVLNNLSLVLSFSGKFLLEVECRQYLNRQISKTIIVSKVIESSAKEDCSVDIPIDNFSGIISYKLTALEDNSVFYDSSYTTSLDEASLSFVKIGIGICTFRREKFVKHNIEIFNKYLIENQESPLYQNLNVFISDNGKTLEADSLSTNNIKIFPNKNLGGAGGFTRTMIEMLKVKDSEHITHILMMDDDVRIDPSAIEKTYAMLRLLKSEYRCAFIGGGMLRLDAMNIQSEAADYFYNVAHKPVKYGYDLSDPEFILKNEIEEPINYFGWWYCCMPMDVLQEGRNLPLPLFIKRDDIEYGLRNGRVFITLNGICVWHEAFDSKYSAYLKYYYYRNLCIMNSLHRPDFRAKNLIREIRGAILNNISTYRYNEAILSLLGVQDFLKGFDWFKEQDAEKLNSVIMRFNYKKQPLAELDFVFSQKQYEDSFNKKRIQNKYKRLFAMGLNYLRKGKKNVIVPSGKIFFEQCYKADTVLNYEESGKVAFITKKSRKQALQIIKLYWQTKNLIKKRFEKVRREFIDRHQELISLEHWNEYFNRDGEKPADKNYIIENSSDKPKVKKKSWLVHFKHFIKMTVARSAMYLLWFVPLKKNRIMIHLHGRRGFQCNPKYILQSLIKQYGQKLEIIWVTPYPSSCKDECPAGIKIVKSNSKQHYLKYIRTKFYITNDSFPQWAVHRLGQKWMNTWHAAMNYKHIGLKYLAQNKGWNKLFFKMGNRQPDYYLSGSQFFTEDTSASFGFDTKVFINTGLPRNDLMFGMHQDIKDKIYNYYHLNKDNKIAIFAPTFRIGFNTSTYGLDFARLKEALCTRFGGSWIIMFRNHNLIEDNKVYTRDCINVSNYPDMQELMVAADILITDYSSCIWDFCLQRKPGFIYAADVEYYKKNDRAFACPMEEWPYPIARTTAELVDNIVNFDEKKFLGALNNHFKEKGAYDTGTACQQVCDIIAKDCLK